MAWSYCESFADLVFVVEFLEFPTLSAHDWSPLVDRGRHGMTRAARSRVNKSKKLSSVAW
jgi:hypothetical protein